MALPDFDYARELAGGVHQAPRFGLDPSDTKASVALRKKYGFCVTKTNLQVALLRSIGVPARSNWRKIR